MTGKNHINI